MKNMKWKAVLALSLIAAFAGAAAFAAEPDANVKGLWLKCPEFPSDAEVVAFSDNPSPLDESLSDVSYLRFLDGVLTFEISRSTMEESAIQGPDDVRDYIEMEVYDAGGDIDKIDVDAEPGVLSEHFTYPCVTAAYMKGQNEDTRMCVSLFIFTDAYLFSASASVAADWFEEYEDRLLGWFLGLEWVEN
jgi:hypothetical protein